MTIRIQQLSAQFPSFGFLWLPIGIVIWVNVALFIFSMQVPLHVKVF